MTAKYLDVMKAAALECGRLILEHSTVSMQAIQKTSFRDIVTQYDIEIQAALIKRLRQAFPEAVFIAEESPSEPISSDKVIFVIDPIDGTANFVKNFHHSCISIGCLTEGYPSAAVVYNPYLNELFYAIRGQGAFLNDTPISVSTEDLTNSLVLFGTSPYNATSSTQTFLTISQIFNKCMDIRRMGSAALDLCYVACGRAGLFFEAQLSLWDYIAGGLILTEAGGTVVKLDGSPLNYSLEKSSILAGSCRTIAQSELLKEVIL